MPREKFKLSETVRFLSRQLNAITGGGEVEISLEVDVEAVAPGQDLRAHARLRSPERARTIDYIVIGMRGTVQRDGEWCDYTESAEIGQGAELPADHELVVPIVLHIPEDAVLSEDGARWLLESRAALDRLVDPRDQLEFTVAE